MSKRTADLKNFSIDELQKRLGDEQENLANLRFQLATSQIESPIKVRTVRRDIARLKTIIRQKQVLQEAQTASTTVKKS